MTVAHGHHIVFYDDRAKLDERVVGYACDAVREGCVFVAITTPGRSAVIEAGLRAMGHDPARLRRDERLQCFDAVATLASLRTEEGLDWEAVDALAHAVADRARELGTGVRLYGEVTRLVWESGQCGLAIELEQRWDRLGVQLGIDVLCSFPASVTVGESSAADVNRLCELHRIATEHDLGRTIALRAFAPDPATVGAARRFVRAQLGGHDDDTVSDAVLVTSELAANAIEHARTPFAVAVARDDAQVTIGVRDANPSLPVRRTPTKDTPGGRGIGIVEAIASRLEIVRTDPGKVVEAVLTIPPAAQARQHPFQTGETQEDPPYVDG